MDGAGFQWGTPAPMPSPYVQPPLPWTYSLIQLHKNKEKLGNPISNPNLVSTPNPKLISLRSFWRLSRRGQMSMSETCRGRGLECPYLVSDAYASLKSVLLMRAKRFCYRWSTSLRIHLGGATIDAIEYRHTKTKSLNTVAAICIATIASTMCVCVQKNKGGGSQKSE